MVLQDLYEARDPKFDAALADMVLDDDAEPLSDAEFDAMVKRVAKEHGLDAAQTAKLRKAADGPIGY